MTVVVPVASPLTAIVPVSVSVTVIVSAVVSESVTFAVVVTVAVGTDNYNCCKERRCRRRDFSFVVVLRAAAAPSLVEGRIRAGRSAA